MLPSPQHHPPPVPPTGTPPPPMDEGLGHTSWRELRRQPPPLKFLHPTPLLSSVDQLLNSMRTNPVGKPKDAHV